MKKTNLKKFNAMFMIFLLCTALLTGCAGQQLSSDFNQDSVKVATQNVVTLINNRDSTGIKALCTVKMQTALTDDVLNQIYAAISEGGKFVQPGDISVGGSTDQTSGEEFAVAVAKAQYELKTLPLQFHLQSK